MRRGAMQGLARVKGKLRALAALPELAVSESQRQLEAAGERAKRAGGRDTGELHDSVKVKTTQAGDTTRVSLEAGAHYRQQAERMRRAIDTPKIAENIMNTLKGAARGAVGHGPTLTEGAFPISRSSV